MLISTSSISKDLFDVNVKLGDSLLRSLPRIDYIWDRGGLVAIDPSTREQ